MAEITARVDTLDAGTIALTARRQALVRPVRASEGGETALRAPDRVEN